MNCIEKLHALHMACEPCVGIIIEFAELPEKEKFHFDDYEKNRDFLIACEKCKEFKIIKGESYES